MIKDKIIAECCKDKIKDISPKVCHNQEAESLSEEVVLWPRGWVYVWCENIMIGSTENEVHLSTWRRNRCNRYMLSFLTATFSEKWPEVPAFISMCRSLLLPESPECPSSELEGSEVPSLVQSLHVVEGGTKAQLEKPRPSKFFL